MTNEIKWLRISNFPHRHADAFYRHVKNVDGEENVYLVDNEDGTKDVILYRTANLDSFFSSE